VRSRDARRLPQSAQEEIRRRAVALTGEGHTQTEVARLLDVSRQSVNEWVRAHREGGDDALAARRRGRRKGEKTKLSPRRQEQIAEAIRGKNPDQLRLPGFLWTRALVCELIHRRFGVHVTEETAGRYLRSWGFTPQKPARRAMERDPEAVEAWLRERYPEIERRARRERALILWADEMGLRSDHTAGRSWAPAGRTPVVEGTGRRFGTNVISAISATGQLRFRVFRERFTASVFIDFLSRLIRGTDAQKVILILDGHPVHRARKVREWVGRHAEEIELRFLPGYSPELNPTELLNQDVKTNALGRRRPRDQDELIGDTRSYLRSTQRRPDIVANYFEERHVRYAGANGV
jgi:transposase